ncbi:MAG TPA: hypothetical protein PKA63_01270 [Oligoflexia bacterium]|nr:hypothetical protein [Oligoflexia bacterium]HMP47280.1 hypothetical protein [Oligoflexia bacterium]
MSQATKSLAHDRSHCAVLVVCQQGQMSGQIRQAIKSLGFTQIATASSHMQAIEKTKLRNFSHVLFDAKPTDMPTFEFVRNMLEMDEKQILIAVSEQPKIDDVFGLLKIGSRGFIVPPFTTEMLETVIVQATEGPPLSDAVLNATDRNAAFTAIILNNLYRLSVAMRQAREFPTAARDVRIYSYGLRESVELAQLFCDGGDDKLREKIIEGCLNRAQDAATRLGRLRKKLKKDRVYDENGNEILDSASA